MAKKRHAKTQCRIGADTALTGDLQFLGTLQIDGTVVGDVRVGENGAGILILSQHGLIEGNVHVDEAIIDGRIKGCIKAQGTIVLRPQARVEGSVHYRSMEITAGARVTGELRKSTADGQGAANPPSAGHSSACDIV